MGTQEPPLHSGARITVQQDFVCVILKCSCGATEPGGSNLQLHFHALPGKTIKRLQIYPVSEIFTFGRVETGRNAAYARKYRIAIRLKNI